MSPFIDQDVQPIVYEMTNIGEWLSLCTCSDDCTAQADEHLPDCPVELRLKDELGF